MATLCLDFGTSSIRAAIRHGGRDVPLAIASGSQIDNASIPSAVFIPDSGREIYFGVHAYEQAVRSKTARFCTVSPKAWLSPSEVRDINSCVVDGFPFTRRHLIAGLLCFAYKEALRVAVDVVSTRAVDVRVSHPVWTDAQRRVLLPIHASLLQHALSGDGAAAIEQKMSIADFQRWCGGLGTATDRISNKIDIEEPVAATLGLVPDVLPNNKSVTLVVDVGAGTIDIGIFLSIVPDQRSTVRRKLIAVAMPRSIFGAGDVIDHELVCLLKEKLGSAGAVHLAAFQANVRYQKEQLFKRGNLPFRGATVRIDELISRPRLARMANIVESEICQMLQDAETSLKLHFDAQSHRLHELDVIFAGGGANLEFLKAVIVPAVRASGLPVVPDIHVPIEPRRFPVEASLARMAVALGGVASEKEWPDTHMTTPTILKGLSTPVRRTS